MKNCRRLTLAAACVLLGFVPVRSFSESAAKLVFREKIDIMGSQILENYMKSSKNLDFKDYSTAETDLNGDGRSEYILRRRDCGNEEALCPHLILAESKDSVVLLLEVEAKKLEISDLKTNGINDILAFRDKKNDYKQERFVWSPMQTGYVSLADTKEADPDKEK